MHLTARAMQAEPFPGGERKFHVTCFFLGAGTRWWKRARVHKPEDTTRGHTTRMCTRRQTTLPRSEVARNNIALCVALVNIRDR